MTYEQAVSRPPARDINYWYDSVAAMNDEDDEEECPLIVPPSFINAYDFEQVDEDVAVLENAVQQLKLEVEKLEKKKKKKSKKQDDNKENLLTSSTVAGQSPTTKDRELASSQQTEVEPSAML